MAVGAFEGELKKEGSSATDSVTDVTDFRKKEEGRRKKRKEHLFPITNSQFLIRKHIFQRRANSEKNASNQCNHRSGQRVPVAKLLLGAIA